MKEDKVPQDNSSTYSGHKKLVYAVDGSGHYKGVKSSGWDVESYATQMAVDELESQTEDAYQDVKNGLASPLKYHMLKLRFDLVSLAQATGLFQWQIKRHLKPSVFNNLSDKKIQRYCDVFAITPEQLKKLPESI